MMSTRGEKILTLLKNKENNLDSSTAVCNKAIPRNKNNKINFPLGEYSPTSNISDAGHVDITHQEETSSLSNSLNVLTPLKNVNGINCYDVLSNMVLDFSNTAGAQCCYDEEKINIDPAIWDNIGNDIVIIPAVSENSPSVSTITKDPYNTERLIMQPMFTENISCQQYHNIENLEYQPTASKTIIAEDQLYRNDNLVIQSIASEATFFAPTDNSFIIDNNCSTQEENVVPSSSTSITEISKDCSESVLNQPVVDVTSNHISVNDVTEVNEHKGRPKKGRKRKIIDQSREDRKRKCQTNKKYVSQRGKTIEPRTFRDFHCRTGCHEKVSLEDRQKEFENFWKLPSYEGKALFVASKVQVAQVKRKRSKKIESRRSYTRTYTLAGVQVCKKCFTQTLQISGDRINNYLTKTTNLEEIKDNRGIAGGSNKLSDAKVAEIVDHINKFPKYKSHYCRGETNSQYLPSHVTIPVMYELYKSEHSKPASISFYKKIFYSHFNLKRKSLKKDTCNFCDSMHTQIENEGSESIKQKLDAHQEQAEAARNLMKSDMRRAAENPSLSVLTFDLEITLPLPRIPTNIVFYKRQLWLYNCGIHCGSSNKGFCFVWLEGQAGRGAQEVGSCLRRYIRDRLDKKTEELILWSDSCGGQNRNIKMVLMLKAVMKEHPTLKKIKMRFLVSGHSFLPNDDDFGDIESALKLQQRLYSPFDYIEIMKKCRTKNKLVVTQMEREDFVGTTTLERQIINRKKDTKGNSISWLQTREIEINEDKPWSVILRKSFNSDDGQEINLKKRVSTRIPTKRDFDFNLELLWPTGKPISQLKLDDLKSMMHLIPADSKQFYRKLQGDENIVDDIDGYNGDIDFAIEEENI